MVKTLTILTCLAGSMPSHHPKMTLESTSLQAGHEIPAVNTCRGRNIPPKLHWHHVPAGANTLAIVMYDKSAPKSKRYLWAVYNIPTEKNWLDTAAPLLRGERIAENSWGHYAYDGPCLSYGKHQYVIKLYALKVRFYFHKKVTTQELLKEMKHRVISTATLSVYYDSDRDKAKSNLQAARNAINHCLR